jgi:hypothetical protein
VLGEANSTITEAFFFLIPLKFSLMKLKFSIKNRSQSLQVMLSTCNKSLDNLVDLNLIEKKEHVLNMKIINKTKKK